MNPFLSLYFLLTSRIPVPTTALISSAVVLLTYAATAPHGTFLGDLGLSALTLSVAAGYVTVLFRNMPYAFETLPESTSAKSFAKTVIVLWTGIFAFLLFAPSPAWVQHGISVNLGVFGLLFLMIQRFDPEMLSQFNWVGRLWKVGQRNAARWIAIRYIGLATALEALTLNGNETEWILGLAILPVVFYALFYWTVIATHPYEDEPEA